ncbi:glycosyl hydrolase [Massilia sp. erpn]|uniref:glycosyl hydrolase n=1 Tax=Massilia sp. erpn TaxID=2738142 RepID=UPI0021031D49|nr:glycosyl hydrolase [Massilia sp. erpn]UTY55968.1 glycosyl hydrolase [Massilia sp. erpn]
MRTKVMAALLGAAAAFAAASAPAAAAPQFVYSPYRHLPLDGAAASINALQGLDAKALSWAFAVGECGAETWGGQPGQTVAAAKVPQFVAAGIGYIVSTGGQGGIFTCSSDEGMEKFIARYDSAHLLGFDFDIEAAQTPAQIDSLLARLVKAQGKRPQLRFSFTVATHAATDGSRRSLNSTGEAVLAAIRRSGLRDYVLNLMVMNYGPAGSKVCAVRGQRCDMGSSAIQAVLNVHMKYKVPLEQIEVTPMIGVNDVAENVFTQSDARTVARAVRDMKLAGLHYWSLDRDKPCGQPTTGADPRCSSLPGVAAGVYGRELGKVAP